MRREGAGVKDSDEDDEDAIADAAVWNRKEAPAPKSISPSISGPSGADSDPVIKQQFGIAQTESTTEASTTVGATTQAAAITQAPDASGSQQASTSSGVTTTLPPLNLNYNSTQEEVSGVAMCENRGLDENQCLWFGCCQWTGSACKSNVGWGECRLDASGKQMCEGMNFNERQCHFIGCCVFNHSAPFNESCMSAVGDDSCIRIRVVPAPAPAPVPLPGSPGVGVPAPPPPVPSSVGYAYTETETFGPRGGGGFNPVDPSDVAGNNNMQSPNMMTETDYQGTAVLKLDDGSVASSADDAAEDDEYDDTLVIKQPMMNPQGPPSDFDPLANMPAIGTMSAGSVPAGAASPGQMGAFGPVLPPPPLPQMGPGGVPIMAGTETETETETETASGGSNSSNSRGRGGSANNNSASTTNNNQNQQASSNGPSMLVIILTLVAVCCGCQAFCLVLAFFYYRSVNRAKPFHDLYAATGKEIPPEWHEDEEVLVDEEHDDLEEDEHPDHPEEQEAAHSG